MMTLDELSDWVADMQMNHPPESTVRIKFYKPDSEEWYDEGELPEIEPGLGIVDPREPEFFYR